MAPNGGPLRLLEFTIVEGFSLSRHIKKDAPIFWQQINISQKWHFQKKCSFLAETAVHLPTAIQSGKKPVRTTELL